MLTANLQKRAGYSFRIESGLLFRDVRTMSNELLEAQSQLLAEIERAHFQGDRVLAFRLERIAQRLFRVIDHQFSARTGATKMPTSTEVPQRHTPCLRKYKFPRDVFFTTDRNPTPWLGYVRTHDLLTMDFHRHLVELITGLVLVNSGLASALGQLVDRID